MKANSKAMVISIASIAAAAALADTVLTSYPADNNLVFSGGTDITEDGAEWGQYHDTLNVNVTGTGNFLHGINSEANPWRNVNLTGDGYLTINRNAQWSIAFGGSTTTNFYGTLHLANISAVVYFGMNGRGARSFENGSIVLEAGDWDQSIFFSDNGDSRHIGDISTTGQNASRLTLRPKNGGTVYVGYLNKNSTFGGNISRDGNFSYSLVKVGTGTWTVDGNVDILGTLTAQEGTLILNGTVSSAVAVGANGTLGGSGTISGTVSGTSGAKLAFTESDALTFTGNADLSSIGLDVDGLDTTTTYTVAKGTTSLPGLTMAQQAQGWIVKVVGGNVVLENASTTIDENLPLTEDTDWTGGLHTLAAGVTVDLNGHNLRVAGVALGAGASFVNNGAGKSYLYIGANGSDKTWVYAANLPATIVPVFTGSSVEIPSDFVPAGGIGFADSATVQSVATDNCANGLYFLGNALVRGNEWQTSCSFPVTVEDEGNVMTISGANWVTYEAFVGTPFYGSGTLKLTTDWAGANLTIGSKEHANSGFFGRVVLDRGTMGVAHTYNIRLEDDNNPGDNSFKNGTVALNNDADADACFKLVSQNWGTNPTYDLAALETSGTHPERVILIANRNDWNASKFSTVKIGRADGATGDGVFAGAISNDNASAASRIFLEKHGTGTWTLSGLVSPGGTLAVEAGAVNLAGATVSDVEGISVAGGAMLKGTSSIPAGVPVTLSEGAILSGGLTLNAAPNMTTAKYVPAFSANVVEPLMLNYDSPSMAGFTLEADAIPVVPVGTTWVIARGPEGSEIVAPTLGATAVAAGWEVRAEGSQVILTSTKLRPLDISGNYSLSDDYDYSTGTINVADGAVIDLCGHTLKIGEITFDGAARFTNSAASKANLVAGCEGNDKSWLWTTPNLMLDSGVRAVVTGAADEIPDTFVPAGGIGFKDTVGTQYVKPSACANGLAFLGNANLREGDNSWNKVKQTFPVLVEGKGNVFTFDHVVESWESTEEFTTTPFSGSGELMLCGTNRVAGYIGFGNNGVDNRSFTGKITINTPEGRTRNAAVNDDSNAADRGFRNATIALCNDEERDVVAIVNSGNYNSAIYCNLGSLVTEGEHPERISIVPIRPAGGAHLIVGRDGRGEGIFAGTFTNYNGETAVNYDIEKHGTGIWTLTGTVGNGGAFSVAEGEVAFSNGVANVSSLSIASGAKALLSGAVNTSPAFASGSTLVLAADSASAVITGDVDLTDVNIEIRMGDFAGNRKRMLLTATGAITGFDPAKVTIPGFDKDPKKYAVEVDGNKILYRLKTIFAVVIR